MAEIVTLIATWTVKPGRTERLGEMLVVRVGRRQIVRLAVDTRHQIEKAKHRPPNVVLRLHGSSNRRRPILEVSMTESFDSFLARLSSQAASKDAIARGVAIEPYSGAQGDGPETTSDKHIITMGAKRPSRFDCHRVSYIKPPGALTLIPAGVSPGMRAETEFDLVICALDSALVSALDSELDRRPEGELRLQANFQDPAAQQLMALLVADANEGHTTERLYTDYLAHALAVRMLYQGRRIQPQTNNRGTSSLPRHVLRRVIERMRSFSSDLSLQALAKESGYSRVHFVRMFRAATGYSPHNYLLNLKLERARELLRNPSTSLIDIALECGFSSHSHMSRLFHKIVGVTPSAYRRSLGHELAPGFIESREKRVQL
jgi:AraC family transcriptional regulator